MKKNLTFKKESTIHECDEEDSTNPEK